jgi:7-cyano-7-deazaguanine synthase
MFNKESVLVLASGGIDSSACISFFKKMNFDVEAVFFDYGQLSNKNEQQAIHKVAEYYSIVIRTVAIRINKSLTGGLVLGRNAAFYFSALMDFQTESGIIASGIHCGTPYYDCSNSFLDAIQHIFDGYANGTVKAVAPFLNFTKNEIWEYCKIEKVPVHLTYSCELGEDQPCGHCDSCKDLEKIYASSHKSN